MTKVKLLCNLATGNGDVAEGKVIDLPEAQAEKLISLGAAEASEDEITAALTEDTATPPPAPYSEPLNPQVAEVETPADPLVSTPQGLVSISADQPSQPPQSPSEANPEIPLEVPTTPQPDPLTNLHLG